MGEKEPAHPGPGSRAIREQRLTAALKLNIHPMLRSIASSVLFITFASLLPLTGCDRNGNPAPALQATKITRSNYDQVHDKASKEEVRAILGPPTSENTEDKLIYKRSTWRYVEGDKYINITFKNDELDSKDTNLGT